MHKGCGGFFEIWTIREHHYCFMECSKCHYRLGGERTEQTVRRLMQTKVSPTIRRA